MGGGGFKAQPQPERVPLIHWIAEQRSANVKWHRNQEIVILYH